MPLLAHETNGTRALSESRVAVQLEDVGERLLRLRDQGVEFRDDLLRFLSLLLCCQRSFVIKLPSTAWLEVDVLLVIPLGSDAEKVSSAAVALGRHVKML